MLLYVRRAPFKYDGSIVILTFSLDVLALVITGWLIAEHCICYILKCRRNNELEMRTHNCIVPVDIGWRNVHEIQSLFLALCHRGIYRTFHLHATRLISFRVLRMRFRLRHRFGWHTVRSPSSRGLRVLEVYPEKGGIACKFNGKDTIWEVLTCSKMPSGSARVTQALGES